MHLLSAHSHSQVDFLKLLYDKLDELHGIFAHTSHRNQFPRPLFKVREDTRVIACVCCTEQGRGAGAGGGHCANMPCGHERAERSQPC